MKIVIIGGSISQIDINTMVEKLAIACDISGVHFTLDDAINNFHNCIYSMSVLKDQLSNIELKHSSQILESPSDNIKEKIFYQKLNQKHQRRCRRG